MLISTFWIVAVIIVSCVTFVAAQFGDEDLFYQGRDMARIISATLAFAFGLGLVVRIL